MADDLSPTQRGGVSKRRPAHTPLGRILLVAFCLLSVGLAVAPATTTAAVLECRHNDDSLAFTLNTSTEIINWPGMRLFNSRVEIITTEEAYKFNFTNGPDPTESVVISRVSGLFSSAIYSQHGKCILFEKPKL